MATIQAGSTGAASLTAVIAAALSWGAGTNPTRCDEASFEAGFSEIARFLSSYGKRRRPSEATRRLSVRLRAGSRD